ncbi:MAG: hypothetical protein IPM24_26385 [Bryobacterales bacterium]|nr:hypothetical protein [Bryobacterales bacterium]
MRRFAALVLVWLPLGGAPANDYAAARQKFNLIETERARPGTSVLLTARELNAYLHTEIRRVAPAGIRDAQLTLSDGVASGRALIDFVKIRQAQGQDPGWLLSKLLDGERPVEVAARIRSGRGWATVDVERVAISGVPIEGAALEFLINTYLRAYYPDARVGKPFELGYGIERLEVAPGVVRVHIGGSKG